MFCFSFVRSQCNEEERLDSNSFNFLSYCISYQKQRNYVCVSVTENNNMKKKKNERINKFDWIFVVFIRFTGFFMFSNSSKFIEYFLCETMKLILFCFCLSAALRLSANFYSVTVGHIQFTVQFSYNHTNRNSDFFFPLLVAFLSPSLSL